ncbi:MAG: hypothetical protein IT515_10950 [Burkholderiales bacterium]|nr:hypothetical protein [Burkholderiales bacterium]
MTRAGLGRLFDGIVCELFLVRGRPMTFGEVLHHVHDEWGADSGGALFRRVQRSIARLVRRRSLIAIGPDRDRLYMAPSMYPRYSRAHRYSALETLHAVAAEPMRQGDGYASGGGQPRREWRK